MCGRAHAQALQDSRDDEILEETSTSPAQEAPGFVTDVRAALAWLLAHPEGRTAGAAAAAAEDARFVWRDGGWIAAAAAPPGLRASLVQLAPV